jgi:hypothetical protein
MPIRSAFVPDRIEFKTHSILVDDISTVLAAAAEG